MTAHPATATLPPGEVNASRLHPLGMPPAEFLRDYWQKRPLLIRGAFKNFVCPIRPDDLAGLACEEMALARCVHYDRVADRWSVRQGPFSESDFADTPSRDWTLLVQDVDKWDVDVRSLLSAFKFIPRWRLDDIMVSYAEPGGSVGAHVDQYDVFLLQGLGHRHWQIDASPSPPLDVREDVEIKLLKTFRPTHMWSLGPGDMLYLPPGVPHHGVAEDECLTLSIGMRAPAVSELLGDLVDELGSMLDDSQRYADPDLVLQRDATELSTDAVRAVRTLLDEALALPETAFADWLGRYLTRYRASALDLSPPAAPKPSAIERTLQRGGVLRPHPFARFAWTRDRRAARLFSQGQSWRCSLSAARRLCDDSPIDAGEYAQLMQSSGELMRALLASGHWVLDRRPG